MSASDEISNIFLDKWNEIENENENENENDDDDDDLLVGCKSKFNENNQLGK